MSHFPRLQKALQRQGIHVEHQHGVYRLRDSQASASVLLPDAFPLEEKAVKQLMAFAAVKDPHSHRGVCQACATPDFHPGSIAPVGTVVATDPDFVIPAIPGTDVNCGCRLLTTSLRHELLSLHETALVSRLQRVLLENGRDVPLSSQAFQALFDEGPEAFIERLGTGGLWGGVDKARLVRELGPCIGLESFGGAARHAPEALVGGREVIRDPGFATIGSGNHFVELQVVEEVYDRQAAYAAGLVKGEVVVMIHSGSRDVGFYVGGRWMDRARQAWPQGLRHPASGLYGLSGELAAQYLEAMGVASRYAWANRVGLAELVRTELDALLGTVASRLVVDVPHNVVLQEEGLNIHRKGATPARTGDLVLIPGSMGDHSYVARGLGNPEWLWSCSHGAGRRVRRQDVRRLKAPESDGSWRCVTLREERRIEEAPSAYKPIGPVIESQEQAGLIESVVRLRPWLTFKV